MQQMLRLPQIVADDGSAMGGRIGAEINRTYGARRHEHRRWPTACHRPCCNFQDGCELPTPDWHDPNRYVLGCETPSSLLRVRIRAGRWKRLPIRTISASDDGLPQTPVASISISVNSSKETVSGFRYQSSRLNREMTIALPKSMNALLSHRPKMYSIVTIERERVPEVCGREYSEFLRAVYGRAKCKTASRRSASTRSIRAA